MVAGREMDALIAQKVMGFKVIKNDGTFPEQWKGESHLIKMKDGDLALVPYYSTKIEDAWLVVEKMIKDGYGISFEYADENWVFSFREPIPVILSLWEEVREESAPHAICKGALIAYGVLQEA